jgi:MarR family 2-MHQ and catechol resistance regulon transcriptional repressor
MAVEHSPGRDPDVEFSLELIIAIGRAYRALEAGVRPYLAERGLGLSEFAVLEILLHKGPLPLGTIRDRILVSGASITYVVSKLETRGLVRRSPSPDDHRVVIAELTKTGRALVGGIFDGHAAHLRHLMAGLSAEEKRVASRLLRQLAEHVMTPGARVPAPA